MQRIIDPVLVHLANNTLGQTTRSGRDVLIPFDALDGFGQVLGGISPWLNLGADETEEGQLRAKSVQFCTQCLESAFDPKSRDSMTFHSQNDLQSLHISCTDCFAVTL
jgi:hypothetical protein